MFASKNAQNRYLQYSSLPRHGGARCLSALLTFLAGLKADVIALRQEVIGAGPTFGHAEEIGAPLGMGG